MTAKKRPARRKPARKVARKPIARRPVRRGGSWQQRLATRFALGIAKAAEGHREVVRSRKDAAILRQTHKGCKPCNGTGTIYTQDKKTGAFKGSKACTAKPATMKVSRWDVAKEARFGVDKNSGLIGWKCPCGGKEKPRYRDAKTATAALRTHERKKHGGTTVGGTWYAQTMEAKPTGKPAAVKPAVSKVAVNSGKTDAEWEKQNPSRKAKATECWQCAGGGALYSAFGGEQITVVCNECQGTGKPKATAGRP